MVYTTSGDFNIAKALNDIFALKGIKNTEGRRAVVCERLLRKTVSISRDGTRIMNLERFVG